MSEPVARLAGRALLIDPDERVLLLHEQLEDGESHWLTPGGGVEGPERPSEAAVREVFEETGIVIALPDDVEPIRVNREVWSWAGVTYDQANHFFVAAVPAGLAVAPDRLTRLEEQTQLGHRWWTLAELRATGETVYPDGFADLLERVLRAAAAGA
jgi:ADP-ribose pyrophosphatase YjhB (NUDIX family)